MGVDLCLNARYGERVTPSRDVAQDEWAAAPSLVIDLDKRASAGPGKRRFSRLPDPPPLADVADYLTKAEFLSKQQAGEIVGLNAKTVEREIQRGNLRAFKLASRVRIKRSDLDEWVARSALYPSVHDI